MPVDRGPRRNRMIRISPIRLIGADGEQVGIIETSEAIIMAQEAGLDLVEVSPDARPPVCKLLDYGRHKYEQSRMERQSRRNSTDTTPKEVRFRPNTGQRDLEVKIDRTKKFLDNGLRVRLTVRFRGAEMRRQDVGRATLRKATEMLEGFGKLDSPIPEMQGRMLSVTMLPLAKKGQAGDKPDDKPVAKKTTAPAPQEAAKPAAKKAEAKAAKPAEQEAAKPAEKKTAEPAEQEAAEPAAKKAAKPAAKKAAKPAAKKAAKPAAKKAAKKADNQAEQEATTENEAPASSE